MPPDHVIKMFRRVSYKQHPLIKRVSRCNMSYNGLLFSLVGVTRLELATSRPPDAYSNQLSYTPLKYCVRDEIRTHTAFRPLPPQSSVSTNSTTRTSKRSDEALSEKRDSNPRPRPWQGRALPTELFSQMFSGIYPHEVERSASVLTII